MNSTLVDFSENPKLVSEKFPTLLVLKLSMEKVRNKSETGVRNKIQKLDNHLTLLPYTGKKILTFF